MKLLAKSILAAGIVSLSTVANAELVQDCVLEGKISKRNNTTLIDFKRAKSSVDGKRCRVSEKNQFRVPKDYSIGNAPHGSKVSYRYTVDENEKSEWTLIDLSHNE